MTRTSPAQLSFSSGEIDPLLHRRADYLRFQTGMQKCRGFLPLPQGGFTRLPGTIRRGNTRGNAKGVLVPFQFAANDALVLEFVPGFMRVWRYGALIMAGASPYQLATPYGAADLPNLRWVQSADVIYLVDGAHPMQRLSRFALDNWTIDAQVLNRGPFRVQNTNAARNLQASAATGTITLTADWAFFTAAHVDSLLRLVPTDQTGDLLWTSNESLSVGNRRVYGEYTYELVEGSNAGEEPPVHTSGKARVNNSTIWRYIGDNTGIVRITAVASGTSATATVLRRVPQSCVAEPTYRWSEGAWSDLYGYPSGIEFYGQRMVASATPTDPRTLWFSAVGSYSDYLDGTKADDPFAYAIAGTSTINAILGLQRGANGLHVFALGEEYIGRPLKSEQVIGATNIDFVTIGGTGSNGARPVCPDGDPIFISRDETRLLVQPYQLEADRPRAKSLSRPSQHIGKGQFQDIVWQMAPEPTGWLRLLNGDLATVIYDPDEDILGWAVHSLAGGVVEATAIVPDITGAQDVLMLIVQRVVNGATQRFVEELSLPFTAMAPDAAPDTANHLFCAQRFSAATPFTSLSVPHLAGETVHAWTDAGAFPDLPVALDGTVTLPYEVTAAWVGLFDDTHEVISLDVQAAAQNGNTAGRQKRLKDVAVSFDRTAQGLVRVIEKEGRRQIEHSARPLIALPVGTSLTEVLTGLSLTGSLTGNATEVFIALRPYGGAPLTVTSLVPTVEEAGR